MYSIRVLSCAPSVTDGGVFVAHATNVGKTVYVYLRLATVYLCTHYAYAERGHKTIPKAQGRIVATQSTQSHRGQNQIEDRTHCLQRPTLYHSMPIYARMR